MTGKFDGSEGGNGEIFGLSRRSGEFENGSQSQSLLYSVRQMHSLFCALRNFLPHVRPRLERVALLSKEVCQKSHWSFHNGAHGVG